MVTRLRHLASDSRQHLQGFLLSLVGEVVNTHGPVEPDKDNIRQEPYTLPQGFTWDALDLGDRGVVSTGSSVQGSLAWLAAPCLDSRGWVWGWELVLHHSRQLSSSVVMASPWA